MTRPTSSPAGPSLTRPTATGPATYEIRVAGHLDDHWAATLDDLALVRLDDGTTSLTGPVVDQARLHGVLARIRDLGVPLLTLRTLDRAGAAAERASEAQPGGVCTWRSSSSASPAASAGCSQELCSRGDTVRGLVRTPDQQAELARRGVDTRVGELARSTAEELATLIGDVDVIVFAAGSNGGSRAVTQAIDGDGVEKAIRAARRTGIDRFALVSVLPESWRERNLDAEVEYYFAVKKAADVAVSRSGLDWLVLRPSLLVDEPGVGTVSLGPAESHGHISREDVAGTLAELLHEPRIGRQILELDSGSTPIDDAVRTNVRRCWTSSSQTPSTG